MRVWIGFDPIDEMAASICASSIRRRSKVEARYLRADDPVISSVYRRPEYRTKTGQRHDGITGKPFSTDFSFRRFLIPWREGYEGWAVFCDPDMVWLDSVESLMEHADPRYALMVCKHEHVPSNTTKMEGLEQTIYDRKNWSSLILWNCGHGAIREITPREVNSLPGHELHGFRMIPDSLIGSLPLEWNYLVGHMPADFDRPPKVIHHTDGSPCMRSYNTAPFSEPFWTEAKDFWFHGREHR